MAYFRCVGGVGGGAVLTLTYSSEFYGETITATDGTKTVTKVAPSTGTMDITLPESGTWVVSATIDGQTYSTTVTVNLGYTASLEAIPDGSTVTPTDDIQTWLKCAGIRDKTSYTTLSDVLGDTDTLIALCADSNACDYMARSTNWSSGVAADSTAMFIVGKYNYCGNALLDNNTWATAIQNSAYSSYVDPVPVTWSNTLIHSAVEDSIFYMDEGTPVALCTIASGDTEDVDMSSFKGQTLTLVSTVAKDPTNLSNDFSMNVRITPNITEIYLMPYGVFYWYGSEVENNKAKSIASNLTDLSRVAPTVTRNKNTMVITEPNGSRGEVYWNKYVGLVDAHVIYSGTAQANPYTHTELFSTTALPDYVPADWDDNYAIYMIGRNESSIPLTHKNGTIKDRTYIKAWMTNNSAKTVTLYALWLE